MNIEKNAEYPASPAEIRGLSTALAARYIGLSVSFLEKSRINQTKLPSSNRARRLS